MKKLYKVKVELEIICEGKPKPIDIALIQAPGPIDYLFDLPQSEALDPFVQSLKVISSKPLSKSEADKALGNGTLTDAECIEIAKDHHGSAVRDNRRAELIEIGKRIERGDY